MPQTITNRADKSGLSPAYLFISNDFDAGKWSSPGKGNSLSGRLAGRRILIVEDEALVALDLQFAFEDEGGIVIGPALSLEDAMHCATSEQHIHGAILDVDLNGYDVFPVAEHLCARGIPFVFHTGHGSRASLSERFPGSLTCSKPTMPETLITALLRIAG